MNFCAFCHRYSLGELVPISGFTSAKACAECAETIRAAVEPARREQDAQGELQRDA
jgi:hypothetical protein